MTSVQLDFQIYCEVKEDGNCVFFNSFIHKNIPSTAVSIDSSTHEVLLSGLNSQLLVYIDPTIPPDITGKHLKLRDKFTKLDVETKEWIVDNEATNSNQRIVLLLQAKQMFRTYLPYSSGYLFNELTEAQQMDLVTYLDSLNVIIKNTDAEISALPNIPFVI